MFSWPEWTIEFSGRLKKTDCHTSGIRRGQRIKEGPKGDTWPVGGGREWRVEVIDQFFFVALWLYQVPLISDSPPFFF